MPEVETSTWIEAPLARVYAIAQDTDSYPDFIRDVQSVKVVERSGNRLIVDYVGIVPTFNLKIRWRQEELWDDATHASTFKQIEGDYDRMTGTWSFKEEKNGVRFDQKLDYEYNVPTIGPLIKKVIQGLVVKNLENIGQAIKTRAESSPAS
jgi:ribosome-associated toxin RatA of RatAB toxin-antitoxin module